MVTGVELATELVLTVKGALVVLPALTVTLPVTEATLGLLLDSETVTSLDRAVLSSTVPVTVSPPVTLDELRLTEDTLTEVEPEEQPGKAKDAIRVLHAFPLAG